MILLGSTLYRMCGRCVMMFEEFDHAQSQQPETQVCVCLFVCVWHLGRQTDCPPSLVSIELSFLPPSGNDCFKVPAATLGRTTLLSSNRNRTFNNARHGKKNLTQTATYYLLRNLTKKSSPRPSLYFHSYSHCMVCGRYVNSELKPLCLRHFSPLLKEDEQSTESTSFYP